MPEQPDLRLEFRSSEERLPVVVRVEHGDGGWTPGPFVSIEAGSEIELDPEELRWLVEDAGPRALAELRGLESHGAPGESTPDDRSGAASSLLATSDTVGEEDHGGPSQPQSPPPTPTGTPRDGAA